MESKTAYIPMDRCLSLSTGVSLPDRTQGSALFADVSGFTPLTEAMLKAYGPRRGPEELTRQLNRIYDALVSEVHRYGGSVIALSGDAVTCWLDGDDGRRATACGLDMQRTMSQFAALEIPGAGTVSLAMKVAVAVGPVRRFLVGDPAIQYIDVLAGATLDRMAAGEHHANKGEVVVDTEAVTRLGGQLELSEWRDEPESGERFAVVSRFLPGLQVEAAPWPTFAADTLSEEQLRPWLLPPVYERLQAGKGEFLAELRPAVVLFLSFDGIDFDADERAGAKLDAYICWVQTILAHYEGYLLQLTVGDKGSYLYTAFGAPIAHEDDARRAAAAALELRNLPIALNFISNVKIGISQGQIYTGAYGGTMRRTYGVMGDDVNLAARLMQAAAPGQILVSANARQPVADTFSWDSLPLLKVKGKAEPVKVFSLNGPKERQAIHLQEPTYALPMVGREAELDLIGQKLSQALAGHGQIVGITAEAGMGKSRLVAEIIRLANDHQMVAYGGECQSYGTNISYLVWHSIWRGFFHLDSIREAPEQITQLEQQLKLIDPTLTPRLPLLGVALNISIPDNELTHSFDAKLRKSSLEALLIDCLRARARKTPLLLVLEDCHWLDPLSHDLLEEVGRAIVDLPVLLVIAMRPPELQRLQAPRVSQLPHFTEIVLADFTEQQAERLITLKLHQFFGAQAELPRILVERITSRAQGNPFYIEELLNFLHDQVLDPHDGEALEQFDLPTSLHSLILSRIDRLSESQKSMVKVASVIGRLFRAAWLWGVYPELGEPHRIKADLDVLSQLDLIPMDTPEPELTYLFKHVITQEVAYESLPYATRAILHEQLAWFIERAYSTSIEQFIDLLAFHYERSQNEAKKREYLRKAGELAQANYANEAAISYYERVLPLLPEPERVTVMLKLSEVLQLVGQWNDAGNLLQQALQLAEQLGDQSAQAWCQTLTGELFRKQGLYAEASAWFERAKAGFEELGDRAGVAQVLHYNGHLADGQGDYEAARALYEASLIIRRELDDKTRIASLLSNLGLVAHHQGDFESARRLYEESLDLRYELKDKWAIGVSLNNLGYLNFDLGDYEAAGTQLEVAIGLQREVGDRLMMAIALNNLGNVARAQHNYAEARRLYEESLTINKELGDREGIAYLLQDIGGLAVLQGRPERTLRLFGAVEELRQQIGAPLPPTELANFEKVLEAARQDLGEEAGASIIAEGRAMSLEEAIDYAFQVE
ncbi:MAG: tetratricopeptide repeat protein [Anaerolineae bacterium]|nr:tetratricopeptide repeat protein [Anaerolineae bacterium]